MAKIIAEVGSNWRTGVGEPGSKEDYDNIIEYVKKAADCGADIVKFQLFEAETLYSKKRAPEVYDRVKAFEFPVNFLGAASEQCLISGIDLWASVFSYDLGCQAIDFVDGLKIASGDITNFNLFTGAISLANEYKRTFAFSTGAATSNEVENALRIARNLSLKRPIVFQCDSSYPAYPTNANLRAMLQYEHSVRALGYSDHTIGYDAAIIAVGCGYTFFEKHFRLNNTWDKSPDYTVSLPEKEFRQYSEKIWLAESVMGNDRKEPNSNEMNERIWARRGKDGLRPVDVEL